MRADLGPAVRLYRTRQDDGSPHVEAHGAGFDIVVTERGREIDRQRDLSQAEAARYFISGMAFDNATRDEARSRATAGTDAYSRWNWMALAIATMDRISPEFGDYARADYAEVLRSHPLRRDEVRASRVPIPQWALPPDAAGDHDGHPHQPSVTP